ncbi:hypothetical protein [Tepidimonas sp.]|uniref:hypothetical protein n=1 Tax=Tepidimonas sp. TaxID=2002775 RepID=UPI002FE1A099
MIVGIALLRARRIDDNPRKGMRFVFAVHVPIAGLALLPPTPLLAAAVGIGGAVLRMVLVLRRVVSGLFEPPLEKRRPGPYH